nr:reverse transcriptase domain-containing protein [Tanacetum cinerariifolium]
MIREEGNRKRSFEEGRSSLTDRLTFPAIPQNQLTDEPIIEEGIIKGNKLRRILVDGGSSSEIMYKHCFRNLNINIRIKLRRCRAPMVGLSGKTYHPLGVIDLRVTIGRAGRSKTVLMEFAILKCHSPYNVIIGRIKMRSIRAVGSTIHSMIKFLTNQGIKTMETSREAIWECRQLERVQGSRKEVQWRQHKELMSRIREQVILRTKSSSRRAPNSGSVSLEKTWDKEDTKEFCGKRIVSKRTVVTRFVMEHQLKIYHFGEPVIHKKRPMTPDERLVLKEKVLRLAKGRDDQKDLAPHVRMRFETTEGSGWTNEAEKALQRIKRKLNKLQTLAVPKEGEILMLCLRQKDETISFVLLIEREGIQIHVSYVSRPLKGMEICYTPTEKMVTGSHNKIPERNL